MGSSRDCTSTMLVSETYLSKFHVDPREAFQFYTTPAVLGWIVADSIGIAMPSSGDKKRSCRNYYYTTKVEEGFIFFY